MPSPLSSRIADLSSSDESKRLTAAVEIYRAGRTPADRAVLAWWTNDEFYSLLHGLKPSVTVGLAVERETFQKIREASGSPRLADVPPDQDAEEFELHFPNGIALDVLTTKEPGGSGAIARYLAKFGEGVQQVEYRCKNVDQRRPRHGNLEAGIRRDARLPSDAAGRGWHARQFFSRCVARLREDPHRALRIIGQQC